jgi:hypothetical protein
VLNTNRFRALNDVRTGDQSLARIDELLIARPDMDRSKPTTYSSRGTVRLVYGSGFIHSAPISTAGTDSKTGLSAPATRTGIRPEPDG